MLKATLIATLLGATTLAAAAQTPAEPTPAPAGDPVTESVTTPQDVGPDLETEPLTNRSEHEGFGRAFTEPVTAERVEGAGVYTEDEEKIGSIGDLVLDADGKVRHVIVEVGGVLGVGAKRVALEMEQVDLVQAHDGDEVRAYLPMTRDQVEALPESDL